jgi:hypothetical protein
MALGVFANALRNPRHIAKMTFKQKRRLIEYAFDGVDRLGNPLGVRIHWDERGKYSVRISGKLGRSLLRWGEVVRAHYEVHPGEYVPIEEDFGVGEYIPDKDDLGDKKSIPVRKY